MAAGLASRSASAWPGTTVGAAGPPQAGGSRGSLLGLGPGRSPAGDSISPGAGEAAAERLENLPCLRAAAAVECGEAAANIAAQ